MEILEIQNGRGAVIAFDFPGKVIEGEGRDVEQTDIKFFFQVQVFFKVIARKEKVLESSENYIVSRIGMLYAVNVNPFNGFIEREFTGSIAVVKVKLTGVRGYHINVMPPFLKPFGKIKKGMGGAPYLRDKIGNNN
jgi:hypothetical protein